MNNLFKNFRNAIVSFVIIMSVACHYPQSPTELLVSKNNSLIINVTNLSKSYPYWNAGFGSFIVADETLREDLILTASDTTKYKAKRLEVIEKELMLQKISLIRFVINTKEFEDELMKGKFRSSVDRSGPNGNIKMGDVYDNKRLLTVLRRREYNVTIRKGILQAGAAAVGVVGPSLYVLSDDDRATSNSYWIAFPNNEDWAGGGYVLDNYMAGVVFHEMLHNTGFSHGVDSHDTTYGIEGVFTSVYGNNNFQKKYAKQLREFKGFYSKIYSKWLQSPTLYIQPKNLSLTANSSDSLDNIDDVNIDKGLTTCSLFHDGTYLLE